MSRWGEYRKSLAFAGYTFAPVDVTERCTKDTISRFHEARKDDPIMATTNLFGDIINQGHIQAQFDSS